MAVKIDLPINADSGHVALLRDESAGFSIQVNQGAGYVWAEKYYQLKSYFKPIGIGTESTVRPGYYLVKEQNFRDIGGGFFEWDRLYANVPNTWSDTEQMAFNYTAVRSVITTGGDDPGIETFSTSRSALLSVKVEHSYQIGYPGDTQAQSVTDPVYTSGSSVPAGVTVRPKEVTEYLGDIWEIKTFTSLVSFNA